MKALVKIAPIVIALASLVSFYFAYSLGNQRTGLRTELASTKSDLQQTQTKLGNTQKELTDTTATLRQRDNDLAQTKANLDAEKTKFALKERELEQANAAKQAAEQQVAQLKDQIAASEKAMADLKEKLEGLDVVNIEDLTKKLQAITDENKVLADKLAVLTTEKDQLEKKLVDATTTPADLRGKVALANSQWNFLVMDLGREKRVQPNSQFLVYRDNLLIAKAKVTSVYPNSSVADLMPGFTTRAPQAGDLVVFQAQDKKL
jgi:chromosome segregation ATPase